MSTARAVSPSHAARTRRPVIVACAVTLLAGASACGMFAEDPPSSNGADSSSGPPSADAPATDSRRADIDWRQAAGESINLVYVQSALMDEVMAMAPEFEALTGIAVRGEGLSEQAMLDALTLDFTSGSGEYDVVQVAPYEVPKYVERGWIRDLSDFLDDPDLTDAAWYDYDDFLPAPAGSLRVGDTIAAAPLDAFPGVLHYRKDLFAKYDIEVPETMAELEAAAAKLNGRDTNGDGEPDLWGIGLRGQHYQFALQSFVYTAGGRYLSEDGTKLDLTSPETIAGIEQYVRLIQNYAPPGYASISWAELLEDFLAGRVAMTIDGLVWSQNYQNKELSQVAGKVGVAPMPGWRSGEKGEPGLWSWGLGVSAASEHPEAAWLWTQWVTSKAQSLELSKVRHATSRTSVTEHREWQQVVGGLQGGAWMRRYTEDLARADPNYHVVQVGGHAFPAAAELHQTVGIQAQAAMAGQKTTTEAMADAESYLQRLLE